MKKLYVLSSLLFIASSLWAEDYKVTVDAGIEFTLGWKTGAPKSAGNGTHFVPLNNVEPTIKELENGKRELTFDLTDKYYYIYNASLAGHRSLKGYFCFFATETEGKQVNPVFNLSAADFGDKLPTWMNHDASANNGSNVADIFLNINERGFLHMQTGEERDLFAQRNWQLINSIMNYSVEPDYHYTVINELGEADNSVVTLDTTHTTWNPWVRLKAVGKGTAIVLVTYDACCTKIHAANGTTSDFYLNDQEGEWSALWPENTGVFVVSVGQDSSAVVTNMKNAEGLNVITTGSNAGKPTRYAAEHVDAELDVFYFTDPQPGYTYSFVPQNAAKVEIAYPTIGESMTTYSGFTEQGVSIVADTLYQVLLKEGTNIVRLTDAQGNATYQVLRAKKASYQITNLTHPDKMAQAGDTLRVQYSGLYHPCNKLSGIYNMTGAIVYQGLANDNSIVGGAGQYNFGGTAKAQAFTFVIPADFDASAHSSFSIGTGLLRASGFGSAYGAHRFITREKGATPNLNAVVGTSYFGQLPEISVAVENPMFAELINFEDVDLAGATFYNGADLAGLISTAGNFSFINYTDPQNSSWNGFAISATTGNNYTGSWNDDTQYNSCVGGGMQSKQFAVGYYSQYNAAMDDQYPDIYATSNMRPEYLHVTNAAYTLTSLLNGDAYSHKFTKADSLMLIVKGLTKDDEETGSVSIALAKDSLFLTEWTKIDLTPLGVVDHIRFSMTSTDEAYGFINTPTYFCLDNLKISLTDEEPVATGISPLAHKCNSGHTLFDLQGRRMQHLAQPGLYLRNGRPILIK